MEYFKDVTLDGLSWEKTNELAVLEPYPKTHVLTAVQNKRSAILVHRQMPAELVHKFELFSLERYRQALKIIGSEQLAQSGLVYAHAMKGKVRLSSEALMQTQELPLSLLLTIHGPWSSLRSINRDVPPKLDYKSIRKGLIETTGYLTGSSTVIDWDSTIRGEEISALLMWGVSINMINEYLLANSLAYPPKRLETLNRILRSSSTSPAVMISLNNSITWGRQVVSFLPGRYNAASSILSKAGFPMYNQPITTNAVFVPIIMLDNPDFDKEKVARARLTNKILELPTRTSTSFHEWNYNYPLQEP